MLSHTVALPPGLLALARAAGTEVWVEANAALCR
jgi:hypothetical protein